MSRPSAFVTGATGFAGGHLCRILRGRGWEVTALVRTPERAERVSRSGVRIVVGDVTKPATLENAIRRGDLVFHLAAVFRDVGAPDTLYEAVNVDGTRHVIEAAARAGAARVVHCSTVGVYGDTGAEPADEQRPLTRSDDPYTRTKVAGEVLARSLFRDLSVPGVVVRPGAGYGAGELRYLKLFRGIQRGHFIMIGDGRARQNIASIEDICAGMILAATNPAAAGKVFNLGAAENTSVGDLAATTAQVLGASPPRLRIPIAPVLLAAQTAELLWTVLPGEPPLHRRRVGFFTVNRAHRIARAKQLLGYEPLVELGSGLRALADWYRSKGFLSSLSHVGQTEKLNRL